MITVVSKAQNAEVLGPSALDADHAGGWVWVDLLDPSETEVLDLGERFSIDPLVIEDLLQESIFPKVDDFGDYLFAVLHALGSAGGRLTTTEVDVLVWGDRLVTMHREPVESIEWLMEHAMATPSMAEGGPDRMFARLTEVQGRSYLPLLDELDTRIIELEDGALRGDPAIIADVQRLRSDAGRLRRIIAPQREVFSALTRHPSDIVGERAGRRFSSVYDHHYRMVESLDLGRALLTAIMDTYRSTVAERTNEVMKVLTVYAAVLLPLSLLAGIYGMNFANIPELGWRWGYFALLGAMAILATGQIVYFVRRGFIGRWRVPAARLVGRGLSAVAKAPIHLLSGLIVSRDEP